MDEPAEMIILMQGNGFGSNAAVTQMAQGDFYCRPATEIDLPEIAAIYTLCVRNGDGAYDDRVEPADLVLRYRRLLQGGLPFIVAASPGRVLGFAHAEAYQAGSGFTHCVQSFVWIRAAHRGRGVGSAVLRSLLLSCRQARYRQVTSLVLLDNEAALALHRQLGFVVMGWHREACFTGGRLRDALLLRHDLWSHGTAPELADDAAMPTPAAVGPMVAHAQGLGA
jgi:phosphinothricin acetyltransferase